MMKNKISTALIGFFVFIVLMIAALPVVAEEHALSWKAPTEREDNTPLAPEEISHFNVYDAVTGEDVLLDIAGTLTSIVHDFPTGTHKVVMTVIDTDGRESRFSQIVEVVSAPRPKPVTVFSSKRVQ